MSVALILFFIERALMPFISGYKFAQIEISALCSSLLCCRAIDATIEQRFSSQLCFLNSNSRCPSVPQVKKRVKR